MNHTSTRTGSYERALTASKRVRWDLDKDVIAGRWLDAEHKFLPDGLSLVDRLPFLTEPEARLFSQVQGRTYANIFGLVERFISTKVIEASRRHALADQVAFEALVRFGDEELKHQEMFRRVEVMAADIMPAGYRFVADPDLVASVVLRKATWAVLALTCHIELFTLAHYRDSMRTDPSLSPLFNDVFRHHWMEESQHAMLDELEWRDEDSRLTQAQREIAVTDFIDLVLAVDAILQDQAAADARYFVASADRSFGDDEPRIAACLLEAYRYQYIFSGLEQTRFPHILAELVGHEQNARIGRALAALT
jgi:hypothetical protein